MSEWPAWHDMNYVCDIPSELGSVIGLSVRGNSVVAETESGIPFIVPNLPQPPQEKES